MDRKIAFITGITGQDGSYLSELLLEKGYVVYGIIRRTSLINTKRIDHLYKNSRFQVKYGDLTDACGLQRVLIEITNRHPDMDRLEVYNLAAQSHVKVSFELPEYTGNVNALGTLRILDAVRTLNLGNRVRIYQASTSELYGKVQERPQNEKTPFYPMSPYGIAKLYGFWITKNYRESYDMFACNGILFNHEGPRRGETFVTRKITRGIGKIIRGEEQFLVMGNLNAYRDWGDARDYVRGMWMMLQAQTPDDYVLATGKMKSVREFIEYCFSLYNYTITWSGNYVDEIGCDQHGIIRVKVSDKYFRPAEVIELCGDASKAKCELGWEPEISWTQMVQDMMNVDIIRHD